MEISPSIIWISGIVLAIIIAIIVAKKVTVSFKGLKLSTDKTDDKIEKTNKLIIKGSGNKTEQDVKTKGKNMNKNNDLEIEGNNNETKQDTD